MASLFAGLQQKVMSQLPGLIESSEPQIENALRSAIQKMAAHPNEAMLFHTNWKKLNGVVEDELSKIVPSQGGKRTKTSKRRRHTKKK